jgi:hypothetical protein
MKIEDLDWQIHPMYEGWTTPEIVKKTLIKEDMPMRAILSTSNGDEYSIVKGEPFIFGSDPYEIMQIAGKDSPLMHEPKTMTTAELEDFINGL